MYVYHAPAGGVWDFDCDGVVTPRWEATGVICDGCAGGVAPGWTGGTVPQCAAVAELAECTEADGVCDDAVMDATQECR
jgi:hypothetical protein